jgi:hypothetical protein
MKSPIFVVDRSGDVLVFGSPFEACSWLESIDVEDGEYAGACDVEGRRLVIGVARPTKRSRFLGIESYELTPVTIESTESAPSYQQELAQAILSALERRGRVVPPGTSFDEVLQLAEAFLKSEEKRG